MVGVFTYINTPILKPFSHILVILSLKSSAYVLRKQQGVLEKWFTQVKGYFQKVCSRIFYLSLRCLVTRLIACFFANTTVARFNKSSLSVALRTIAKIFNQIFRSVLWRNGRRRKHFEFVLLYNEEIWRLVKAQFASAKTSQLILTVISSSNDKVMSFAIYWIRNVEEACVSDLTLA